ncbi:MAG TPA: Rab family GTPase [Longilinea sp.]|nr:Rab family GTPase [Longilinea sp.]
MESITLLKVALIGDGNVGKTSIARRYCEGSFSESRIMTIGVDFQTKVVALEDRTVKLSIWDVAGQDRFAVVRESFYRGTLAAALVYDISDPESFAHLPRWVDEIRGQVPQVKFVVVGNKSDLTGVVSSEDAGAFAASLHAPLCITSALTDNGVEDMFLQLAHQAVG